MQAKEFVKLRMRQHDNINYSIDADGLAYTEDKVLVYNVFAGLIPRKTTPEQTQSYFDTFGNSKSIRLMVDKRKKNRDNAPKMAFVNVELASDAAKALQKPKHSLNGKRIMVNACDSWNQPDYSAKPPTAAQYACH